MSPISIDVQPMCTQPGYAVSLFESSVNYYDTCFGYGYVKVQDGKYKVRFMNDDVNVEKIYDNMEHAADMLSKEVAKAIENQVCVILRDKMQSEIPLKTV